MCSWSVHAWFWMAPGWSRIEQDARRSFAAASSAAITREPLRSFALAPPRTTPVGEGLAKAWSWTRSSAGLRLRRPASPCWSRAKREPVRPRSPSRGSSTWRAPPRRFAGSTSRPPRRWRASSVSLDRARVEGVEVTSFDALAVRLARRAFRGLPRRVVSEAPAAVIRLKRSDALAHALEGFVAARPHLGDDEDRPGQAAREDLLLLFGDRDGLDVVQGQSSLIRASDVEATLLHTRAQFRLRGEEEFADVVTPPG